MNEMTNQMERAFAELPGVRMGPYYSRLHEQYTYGHFLRSMIAPNVLKALHQARKAQELAVSYRGFKVGAAVVGLSQRNAGFLMSPGINAKTNEDGPLNMHAEQLALRTAEAMGADMLSVVTVVGETQTDTQIGHEMHTLHPCGLCRDKLADHPMIDNDATLIFSALPDLRTIEAGTANDFKAYHDKEAPDETRVRLFRFPDLELLQPFVPPESGVAYIEDSEQDTEEERLWTGSIGRYLLEHQLSLQATREEPTA